MTMRYYSGKARGEDSIERIKARLRARTRARRAVATMHSEFFREELARQRVEQGCYPTRRAAYNRASMAAQRATARAFPEDFRRLYERELAAES